MKDFIILCAKVALGVLIGFAFIFGGSHSISKKSEDMKSSINTQLDKITFDTSYNEP